MIAAMIKSAIVLAIAGCVASLMKRQSAAVRHAIWTAGLLGALAIPLCTLTLPSWQARVAGPALSLFQKVVGELGVVRQVAVMLWIAGAAAGVFAGLFLGLPGLILGPVAGAVIGELTVRRDLRQAGRVGLFAGLGFAIGLAVRVAIVFAMVGVAGMAFFLF